MTEIINMINQIVWGIPTQVLILTVGVLLSIKTKWVQIRLFPSAIRFFRKSFQNKDENHSGISGYKALCTALAATVGTGNIAGVAGAIAIGGPGAVFWMWICAFLGMATKYAEAALSVRYREERNDGTLVGGPMYIAKHGLSERWHFLSGIYCFFGVVAAYGVGTSTQVNALIGGVNGAVEALGGRESNFINFVIGIAIAFFVLCAVFGGVKRIGNIASYLVPFASVFYIVLCLGVLVRKNAMIPDALLSILNGAFRPAAVTGGAVGSMFTTLRIGASRGVFTNEAGMGTAGIAHSSACVDYPAQQGLMGILEVFVDTILICTMTALVVLCSGIKIPYGHDLGIRITTAAFANVYGNWINIPIAFALSLFAVATILGWGLYGVRCAQYLFGMNAWKCFSLLQCVFVVGGALLNTGTIWALSEIANGLMAIPNLIIIILCSSEVVVITNEFKQRSNR